MQLSNQDFSHTVGTTELDLTSGSSYAGTSQTQKMEAQFYFDLSNLAAGDEFKLTVYVKPHSSATLKPVWQTWVSGAQSSHLATPEIKLPATGWAFTAQKIAGTDRVIRGGIKMRLDTLQADVITATSIQANAITSAKIAASAIGASQIASNAITSAKIAADAIGASQLAADAATEIAAAVLVAAYEGARTVQDFFRLAAARLWGKATIQATDGAYAYRDDADTKNRIAATVTGTARGTPTLDGT